MSNSYWQRGRRLYGGDEEDTSKWLRGVEPDILGEHLVACYADETLLSVLCEETTPEEIRHVLTVLTRLAARDNRQEERLGQLLSMRLAKLANPALQVAIEIGNPLGPVLTKILGGNSAASPRFYESLERRLPQQTVALREVAVVVTNLLLLDRRHRYEGEPSEANLKKVAGLTNKLAIRLSDLGRREEALTHAKETLELYRELATQRPDAFRPKLAVSLNTLATPLSNLGHHEEALTAAQEAVSVLGPLFVVLPTTFSAWMGEMVQDYTRLAAELGRESDPELLAPILETLRWFQSPGEP